MTIHETVDIPSPDDRRQDILMDAAGFNGYTAVAATVGFEQDSITVEIPADKRRRADHRGGRAYPEGDDDPYWSPALQPMSAEDQAAVRDSLGYRQAHQIAAMAEDREIARKAAGNTAYHLALQRARAEKRKQR